MKDITIRSDLCNACGICVLTCPVSIYSQKIKESPPDITKQDLCISCGHCVAICPNSAIVHPDFPKGSIAPISLNNMVSASELIKLMRTRRSIRVYSDTPIEKRQIEDIIEAARFAPSSHNLQTTKFIVVQNKEILRNLAQMAERYYEKLVRQLSNPLIKQVISLAMGKQAQNIMKVILPSYKNLIAKFQKGEDSVLRNAPVLILFHGDERITGGEVNGQLAVQNAALMAHTLGLGCFYTGYLVDASKRDKSIGQLVSLPEHHKIYGGLAMGHPRIVFKNWIKRKDPDINWLQ